MHPLPSMTFYKKKYRVASKHYANASQYANTNISLPVYPSLSMRDVDYISKTIISLTANEK